MPNAISLPVISFSCAASASSSRNPTLERAENVGLSRPIEIGTVTSCSMPSGCGSRLKLSVPASALADRRLARDDDAAPRGETPTVASTCPALLVTSSRFEFSWFW